MRFLREIGQPEPRVGEHVGHVRTGSARDRVHAYAGLLLRLRPHRELGGPGAREGHRNFEELVEAVDACDPELPEHGRGNGVGAGEVPRVRLRHRPTGRGLTDLHHDDGLAQLRRVVSRQHQGATVLETLDVARDDADLGLVGKMPGEVGELEVDLVAGGRPMREANADLLALEHRPALVTGLRDQRDRRTFEIVAELLERVQVRVRAEQPHVATAHETLEPALTFLALGSRLGESRREDHRELRLAPQHLLECFLGATCEDDREIDVAGDVEDRWVTRVAKHRFALGVHRIERGAVLLRPLRELARHRRVGLRRLIRRADDGDGLRVEEGADVDVAQAERAP